ncbi:MAG: O-antigen ligase family protein [Pseudomonadota bacterium]
MLNPTQPYFYLLAYLAVLYIRPHEFVPFFMGWPVLPILLMLAFLFWLMRQPKNFEAPQFRLMPVLTLAMMLSLVFTGWIGGGLAVLSEFAPVVMLFYMVATSTDSLQRVRQIFLVLSVSVTVLSWHGIDQIEKGIGWTGAELSQGSRITYLGFLNDPNDLAMALVMILPMILHLGHGAGRIVRWITYAAAGAVAYAVYLTNSRGSVLAMGAMVFLYGILRYGVLKSVLVIPVLLIPLIAFGPSRMAEMSADEDSAEGRIEAWYEGVQLLIMRPLFGVGKGQFADYHGLTAHNSFVLAFAELGLVGYFVWLSNIVISWLMLQRIVRSEALVDASPEALSQWEETRGAARTLWYGYVAGLVSAFFLSRSYVVILYLHIALIVAVFQMARAQRPDLPPIGWLERWGQMLALTLGSVVGLWLLTRVLLSFT